MSAPRAFRLTALAAVTMTGGIACDRTPLPVAESSAAIAPASSTIAIHAKTGNISCGADPFPAPYQSVDPCDQLEVSCAALSALFTWNPSIDSSVEAALGRAKPLIVKAGLKNPDGTPIDPFSPFDPNNIGPGRQNLRPGWEKLRSSGKALAAYVTKESVKPGTDPYYYIWQFEYAPSDMSADGTPKSGTSADGETWEWSVVTAVSNVDGPGYKLSSTGEYGPRRPVLDDNPGFTPSLSNRWGCQHGK